MAEGSASRQSRCLHELPKKSIKLNNFISLDSRNSEVWSASYTAERGPTRQVAAKKVQILPGLTCDSQSDNSEILVLHQINHKNIIKFYGIWKQTEQDVYIIMEHAGRGNLRRFLNECRAKKQRLTENLIWKWIYEAASALHYLETIRHCHRNIMSQHFLIMDDYTLKLGEFGLATQLESTQQTDSGLGACKWMAPEVIKDQLRSPKSDIFSYGIVIWEIYTLEIPYKDHDKNNLQVMNAVCQGVRPPIPEDCPDYLKNLMKRCWNGDRHRRPSSMTVCLELEQYQCTTTDFIVPKDDTPAEVTGISLLEQTLTDKFLMTNLASNLTSEWEELGIHLDFSAAEIAHIKTDNKDTNNIKLTILKMLVQWRQRQNPETGLQSTLGTLSEALNSCNRKDLAYKVRSLSKSK